MNETLGLGPRNEALLSCRAMAIASDAGPKPMQIKSWTSSDFAGWERGIVPC